MHHHHHHQQQQQQLAALLSAALPEASSSSTAASSSSAPPAALEGERPRDQDRVAALNSLHRAIVYPPNSLLVAHSAPFLSQGLFQLLSDQSYSVRRAASVAYGSLCSVVCSTSLTPNGRQNPVIASGLVDRFIAWALPLVRNVGVGNGLAELALEGLREFLTNGDATSTERYVLPILKSCQELLEDERTSLNLLHRLLGMLSLISVKYWHCFQPHFVDIIDLLLGWALVPDLPESERGIIMDTFLQFKNHWTSNLQISIRLLSKFLGDMEVLIQDGGLESAPQLGRLLALFSCFSTVLQAATFGALETNLLKQMCEPLESMVPRLLGCLSTVGEKSGWEKWTKEFWKCLSFVTEILQERFSNFYLTVIDILFQILKVLPASQVPGVLKANLQMLSLQKLALLPSSVQKLLQLNMPFSLLRLHPNHTVVVSVSATYLFLLRHNSNELVSQAITSVMQELEVLINKLKKGHRSQVDYGEVSHLMANQLNLGSEFLEKCSESELISLIKFDLKILLCSVSIGSDGNVPDHLNSATFCNERSGLFATFICEKLDPFESPIQDLLELQIHVLRTMHKLSEAEFLSRLAFYKNSRTEASNHGNDEIQRRLEERPAPPAVIFECLNKYNGYIIRSLSVSSPVAIKIEALDWVASFCDAIIDINKDLNLISDICEPCQPVNISSSLLFVVLDAASDREIKVRSNVASVLEKLIQARIIYPGNFYLVAEASLERLGDPDIAIKNAFVRLLTIVLPIAFFRCGIFEDWISFSHSGSIRIGNKDFLNWKQILAVKQLPRQLDSQQLVSILGYISQRWKTPLSTWIQRLVFSCSVTNATLSLLKEDARYLGSDALSIDDKTTETLLEKICPVNNLAAVWWSIHEAARYSVNLRLRTNLGGPTQTFAALERMLLDIAHVLLLDAEQTDSNISIGASNIHLLPMRLLLDFVESLKKYVYNAYEGSSVLPRATRQSSLFFRANKKVCEEWFSRICEPMLNAGLALQCHDAVLHYSALRLQDLQTLMLSLKEKIRGTVISENLQNFRVKLVVDVLKVMRHAALALCRSREPEALVGLHNWVQVTFSSLFVEDCQTDLGNDRNSGYFSWITGLVYQAQGQHEKAAAHFSHLLQSEEVLASMGSEGIQFVIARVIESYSSISDWKSLELWLSELQALRAKHAGKSYSGALTAAGNEINVVHALARFDEGDIQAAWAYLDLTPKSSNELTLDPKLALERSEQMLLRAMLQKDEKMDKVPDELGKAKLMLDEVLSVAPLDGLSEVASYAGQLHCVFAFEEGLKLECQRGFLQLPPMLSSLCQVLDFPISKVHQDPSLWLKLFRVYRTILPTSPFTLMLCQKLISLARKQSNFMLAERMVKNLRDNISKSNHGAFSDLLLADLQYESVLLNYAQGKHEDALFSIWMLVRNCILFPATIASESYKMVKAKACLKLSTWLKQEYCDTLLANVLHKVHADIIESDTIGTPFIKNGHSSSDKNSVSDSNRKVFLEEIVGMSVKSSCHLCPTMGKTWLSYATWCYNQARSSFSPHDAFLQSCSLSPILVPEFPSDRFHLTEEEVSNVRTIITNFFLSKGHGTAENEGDMDEADLLLNQRSESLVSSFIQQSISLIESLAGAPGVESFSGECPSSALASQLQMLFSHPNAQMPKYDVLTCIDQLVEVWWLIRRRRVSLFGHAACSYLRYLSCSSSKIEEYPGVNHNHDFAREKSGSCTLKAALYILHIILNYGAELRETIEPGLASVPMLPWQEITPQLFARLTSHPQREVRGQLEGILMMLGKQSPWSIVYPTLVDINNFEGVPSEELQRLLNFLAKLYPQLIKDVQLVINELGNMTVLWEEQWLSTLQDLHSDVIRRINMLKEEAKRIAENATLSQSEKNKINSAKYSAMMAPIVVALERRLASTSREPETPP